MSAAPEELVSEQTPEETLRRAWGEAIRARRQKLGVTQEKLAPLVGVDQTTISTWELGKTAPPLRHQLTLVRVLKTTHGRLFPHKVKAEAVDA